MVACVVVSRECRDKMTDPTEQTAGAYPEARRDNEPENAAQYLAVVYLPDAWNEEAQDRCSAWVSHIFPRQMIRTAITQMFRVVVSCAWAQIEVESYRA